MSINNLNSVGQTLTAPSILTPPPSRMSVLAKVVIGIAALFFTAFLYVAFSTSTSSSSRSIRREDELNEEQQREVERIRLILLRYFEETVPAEHNAEFQRLFGLFTSDCRITPQDIAAAQSLLVALSSPPSVSPSVRPEPCDQERIAQTRALKDEQDKAFQEALEKDRLKAAQKRSLEERQTAMIKALTSLQADLTQATSDLDARFEALKPIEECWKRFCTIANCNGAIPNQKYSALFSELEERYIKEVEIDLSIPENLFSTPIEQFNARFSDQGEFFDQKRAALTESLEGYTEARERLQQGLAWSRLKAYHAEVGEEFFASQLPKCLTLIREGEELPRPQ